jgi:hypothetical protein
MRWITRQNVKVDRVACPWLIKRFIDPRAEFLFMPEEELLERAREEDAIPFDHAIVRSEAEPSRRALQRGDSRRLQADRSGSAPSWTYLPRCRSQRTGKTLLESPGLRASAQGFALCVSSDDERLTRDFPIYDGLLEYP